MKRILFSLSLVALLVAAPASAQMRAEHGGTGSLANTGTDDTLLVGDGNSFEEATLTDCIDSGDNVITYTASSNTFGCGAFGDNAITITGDWDFGGGGIEVENGITPPSCTAGQLYVDTDATSGQQLMACEGTTFVAQGAGGSGDVTDVGDCSTGACFTAAGTGNSIIFEGSTADGVETTLTAVDPTTSSKTISLPNASGTVAVSVTAPITLSALGDVGLTQDAGTDVTADLEEETHATEHSDGGTDEITAENLATACTNAQVLGGDGAGGVECQTDLDTTKLVMNETVTFLYNGSDKAGDALANSPTGTAPNKNIDVFFNGINLTQVSDCSVSCANDEFSIDGSDIMYVNLAPISGDQVTVSYLF